MQIGSSAWRIKLGGLVVSVATGIWLSCCPIVSAQILFAGISSMETSASSDGSVQIINFQSDLPFQYKKVVLDSNTIILRLYNARLAQNLITPEGSVNLLASGAVQTARIHTPASKSEAYSGVQEVILTGPGLGIRQIKVQGAEELPAQSSASTSVHMMMARVPNAGQKKTAKRVAMKTSLTNLHALAANGVIRDDNHLAQNMQAVAYPAIVETTRIEPEASKPQVLKLSPGPQIAQINGVPTEPSYADSSDGRDSLTQVDAGTQNIYNSISDGGNTVVTSMPRYTGGAKPIEAMTTDNQGHPVLIRPKSQPIPEFAVGRPNNGGYNTLFQVETMDLQQRIGQYLSDALTAYKANQFGLAQKQVQQALMLDARNADLLAALAEIQLKQGEASLAEQNYQKANELSQAKYGARYAQLLTLDGKRKEAIQVLEALYRQNPKQAQVAYMLGTLNEELGQTAQALTYLKQAAQLHPASADIQYNLGLAYELSGDREQAEKHYRQALSLTPSAPDIVKALARVRQGGA